MLWLETIDNALPLAFYCIEVTSNLGPHVQQPLIDLFACHAFGNDIDVLRPQFTKTVRCIVRQLGGCGRPSFYFYIVPICFSLLLCVNLLVSHVLLTFSLTVVAYAVCSVSQSVCMTFARVLLSISICRTLPASACLFVLHVIYHVCRTSCVSTCGPVNQSVCQSVCHACLSRLSVCVSVCLSVMSVCQICLFVT